MEGPPSHVILELLYSCQGLEKIIAPNRGDYFIKSEHYDVSEMR